MPERRSALLFDIDGTLADTDELHHEAFNIVLNPRGHIFDLERYSRELQGFSTQSICDRFLAEEPRERQQAIMEEKESLFRRLVADRIRPMPGLMAVLDRADAAGIPMVAVTNAPRPNAQMLLAGLKIADRFRAVIIGDELAHGKPHPLPYLEGLKAAGADARHAMAFEDSRSGITSASSAGIFTVGIGAALSDGDKRAAGASLGARDFEDPHLLATLAAILER